MHANPSHEMLGESTTAVLNALWDCVVTNRRNLAHLLADDGLGDLLDAIEACHAAVQPLALAILAGKALTCPVYAISHQADLADEFICRDGWSQSNLQKAHCLCCSEQPA